MAIDLLAAALFIGFVTLGALRGTLASGVRIAVLVVAYVAGGVAFVGTFVILSVVAAKFLRRDR